MGYSTGLRVLLNRPFGEGGSIDDGLRLGFMGTALGLRLQTKGAQENDEEKNAGSVHKKWGAP